ncbi:MAG: DUF2306 domain-containing protein [Alphaproteobacteria bacterium]|nr:DUF2306 domain-containing protein [Alphaproteobacteria bacterium]MBU1513314.1 DUF2306 domain-containing protein [Alphaproteobacteria bacterium]MBU2096306.1 DUF2306 domain-containing protein [Alphaproteobacteria bacterium]MBU2152846.1 DUF2306 domain-containing protein [Alphaproteobacteria bacterium]MBU2306186.1 DUF2306 domain-containing protein [Alphaproteobacteria bacterium]
MIRNVAVSLCVLTFGLAVPILEINATHVWNPAWPGHARLHEVWQLITNVVLALACLWLVWVRRQVRSAALLGLAVVGGFLAAYALRGAFGGSMVHPDGSELLIGGVNPATAIMLLSMAVLLGCAWPAPASRANPAEHRTETRATGVKGAGQGPRRVQSMTAARALTWSVMLWFVVAVAGQAIFAIYIALFYGGATLRGDVAAWREVMPGRVTVGDTVGIATMGVHLALAFVVTAAGPLQLIPAIRARMPAVHRWVGRVYIVVGFLISLGGLYLIWGRRDADDTLLKSAPLTLNALLIMVFAAMAWRHALARRMALHREWALRLFLAMSGVWFLRIGIMIWVATVGTAGLGGRLEGPVGTGLKFACYLAPLGVLQLYFVAQRSAVASAKWAMAAAMGVLAVATAAGVVMASIAFWLPHI